MYFICCKNVSKELYNRKNNAWIGTLRMNQKGIPPDIQTPHERRENSSVTRWKTSKTYPNK